MNLPQTLRIGFPAYRESFILCTEQQDFAGVAGNKVNVPILDRDEFTAATLTESEMDESGMTKTKLSPDSIQIDMSDVIYVSGKIPEEDKNGSYP